MLDRKIEETIKQLHSRGTSIRQISQLLKISRNSVRRVLRNLEHKKPIQKWQHVTCRLSDLYSKTQGNAVRIQELLKQEGVDIAYSVLTRLLREASLRNPPKRAGEYHPQPGIEIQHDTSVHLVLINGKQVKAQCAGAILAFSRKCYMQYYPRFTRFEARVFLTEALQYFGGSTQLCVIDNTSVVLAGGSGADAVIAPSMESFSDFYKMRFKAHAINHADRKARIERLFHYAENNFLNARIFTSWSELNEQAAYWCTKTANAKIKRSLQSTPEQVFQEQEKMHLHPLPAFIPPVYESFARVVDSQGYVHLDTHRYSVPEKYLTKTVKVLKYYQSIEIYYQEQKLCTHSRIQEGRHGRSTLKGHHASLVKASKKSSLYEPKLLDLDPSLDAYIKALKKRSPGRGNQKIKQLLHFKCSYPWDAFIAAIIKAHQYGLYDMNRLEQMILKQVEGQFFNLEDH